MATSLFVVASLWKEPVINPVNYKARSIPILNVINLYGRVFFFSWMGFMIAFWSWYAFPPLMTITIKKDLHLSAKEISNSNIIALTATLLVRLATGPACDKWGPRKVFASLLLLGSVPTALAGTVTTARGLLVLRFFVGILGGTFVPCQVWCTAFFDKNVVGSANALAGGWGNAGGGITYFVMPAIFDSLVRRQHLTPHQAWRVAFVVPFIVIVATAAAILLLCPDTPTGKWSDRHLASQVTIVARDPTEAPVVASSSVSSNVDEKTGSPRVFQEASDADSKTPNSADMEAQTGLAQAFEIALGEVIQPPNLSRLSSVFFSLQTLTLTSAYFCSFGAELAINSILGAYYVKNFPKLGQTGSGRWAAMFGILNIVARPAGGFISDLLYRYTGSLWLKKTWLHSVAIVTGCFLLAIGLTDPHQKATMMGLVAGMAFFLEAGNGANFALVPHVHPFANGVVSGITGAAGNLGGIIFAIIFRYNGADYAKVFWTIGTIQIGMNLAVSWIRPIPKGQIGGR